MVDIALKNLTRRKIRTILVILGVVVCIFLITTVDGMLTQMKEGLNGDLARYMGKMYLQQRGAGYPPFNSSISDNVGNTVLRRPDLNLEESTPLLLLVVEPADNPMDVAGIVGVGIAPGKERAYISDTQVTSGSGTLLDCRENSVILGGAAAQYYQAKVGQEIIISESSVQVIGILENKGIDSIDKAILMPLSFAQSAFGREGTISVVLLTARDITEARTIAAVVSEDFPNLQVSTQEDMEKEAIKMMEMPNKFMGMISWVIFAVTILMVMNVMIIAVRERTKEIGVMRAIGSTSTNVLATILYETLLLTISGGILGIAIAIPASYLMDWTWILSGEEMLKVSILVILAGIISALYPAYKATKVNPIEALRYE